jgi:hypothetical protein
MRQNVLRLFAPLLLLGLLFGGCSSNDDSKEASAKKDKSTSTTADGTTDGTTTDGVPTKDTVPNPKAPPPPSRTKYCETWAKLMQTDDVDFETEDPNAVKAHYTAVVKVARELAGVAPADIKGAVDVTIHELEKVVASGDTTSDNTDEARVNGKRLQDYAKQYCK